MERNGRGERLQAAINRGKIDVEPDRKLSNDPWRQRLFIASLEEVSLHGFKKENSVNTPT